MPRKKCFRYIEGNPHITFYKPAGVPMNKLEQVVLSIDEYEAIRLADMEGCYQESAALKMQVSRQTFGRIIAAARKKVADALINGKSIKIEKKV